MKILFITDNFPPEVNAPATRTLEHCREWLKLGADITVLTCFPNFPNGKVYDGYKNSLYQKEIIDGIKVIRLWSYITANAGFLKRIMDYTSFAFSAFVAGLFQKPDIIIATSPQFFTTFAGYGLSKVKGRPWIFELRDLWPESIKTVGAMKENAVLRLLEKIELFLYREADAVVALTDAFKSNLISRGIPEEKIRVVTNGSNIELFSHREKNHDLLAKHGLDGKFIIGYIGTHGMAHSLEFIVSSIANLKDDNIHFLFIGDGARKNAVIQLAKEKGLDNVSFLAPVRKELVPAYMSIIDVALVPLLKSDTFKTVIPSKIFEAAAMRRPILLGVEGQAQEIVEQYGAGICFEPENEKDFLESISRIKADSGLYARLQDGCDKLARDYDRKRLAHVMFNYLKDVVKKS